MTLKKPKIKINGTINRQCNKCGKIKECVCFEVEGEIKRMCSECMFNVYGIGKPPKEKFTTENKTCYKCNKESMVRERGNESMTETHVIHNYRCHICNHTMQSKIKKWKK
jgi:hypothetical protein